MVVLLFEDLIVFNPIASHIKTESHKYHLQTSIN